MLSIPPLLVSSARRSPSLVLVCNEDGVLSLRPARVSEGTLAVMLKI